VSFWSILDALLSDPDKQPVNVRLFDRSFALIYWLEKKTRGAGHRPSSNSPGARLAVASSMSGFFLQEPVYKADGADIVDLTGYSFEKL
jgi:hypothetical protein